ncbi:MAG: NAD(P)H-hydrate dehydratase [Bacteroidales bacterium]
MKIFNTKDNREFDEYTVVKESVSFLDLMERAATSVTYEIISRWRRNTPIVVFAGQGNNGGDALAVARMLIDEGYSVLVYLFNPTRSLSSCCEKNLKRLQDMGVDVEEIVQTFIPPDIAPGMLVVDGIFGVGLNRTLSGGYVSLVQYINESGAIVLSIDIPSGLFGEDNRENNPHSIIKANITVSFQYPKLSFMFMENAQYVGEWRIADIGISQEAIDKKETPYYYVEAEDAARLLVKRNRFAEKHDFGHLLLVAGSSGMMGAAQMSARAALRSGAGLVTVHSAGCGEEVLQTAVPEAMFISDTNVNRVTNFSLTRAHTVVAVGPGLGRHKDTIEAISYLINKASVPMVVDADALNIMADNMSLISKLPKYSVITTHFRELDRLFGHSKTFYERMLKGMEVAAKYNITIVLKGANTAIITPTKEVFFNSTGNPGMATAGSGDVLTGVISSLMAQKYSPSVSAVLGVFLHGLAGDMAAASLSEESMTATDIISYLDGAFKKLHTYNI